MYNPTHYYVRVSRAASFTGIGLLHRLRAFLLRGNKLHRHSPSSQALGLFQEETIFTGVCLLHRLRAFSKKIRSSQAFAFFTGSGPFPKRDDLHRRSPSSQAQGLFQEETIFTGVRLLHRLRAFSKKRRSSQAFAFFTGSGPFPKRDDLHRRSPSSQAQGLLGVEPPEVLDVPRVLDRLPLLSFQAHGARPGNMNNIERALPHGRELVQPFPGEDPPEYEVSYLEGPGADVAAVISL